MKVTYSNLQKLKVKLQNARVSQDVHWVVKIVQIQFAKRKKFWPFQMEASAAK